MTSKEADKTTDALRKRLNTAEEDTQLLMKQLEELGFSPDAKERRIKQKNGSHMKNEHKSLAYMPPEGTLSSYNEDNEKRGQQHVKKEHKSSSYMNSKDTYSGYDEESEIKRQLQESRLQHGSQHSQDDPDCDESGHEKENQPNSNSGKIFNSKSSKHRPITPLSLRGLAMPGSLQVQEPRKVEDFMPKTRMSENESRRRQRSEHYDDRVSFKFRLLLKDLIFLRF